LTTLTSGGGVWRRIEEDRSKLLLLLLRWTVVWNRFEREQRGKLYLADFDEVLLNSGVGDRD
jgi:hypothetical protein